MEERARISSYVFLLPLLCSLSEAVYDLPHKNFHSVDVLTSFSFDSNIDGFKHGKSVCARVASKQHTENI